MKKLILPLFLISSHHLYAYTCNKKVNANKVVVFVDLNFSYQESDSAAKAACERGEAFKIIPKYDKSLSVEANTLDKEWDKYWRECPNGSQASNSCKTKYSTLDNKIKNYSAKLDAVKVEASDFKAELSKLAKENKAVTSMTISGHDGGGSVHGTLGGLDKTEIISSFKAAYKNKPALASQFQSVFMWGCWTAGPSEVSYWRDNLPQLKMVGGFFDMGPLNTTEASRDVLHDLLIKEKDICEESDKNSIKRMISSVDNINDTYAAVYAESSCGKNYYYYNTQGVEGTQNINYKPGSHFVEFDKTFDCKLMKTEIDQKRNLYEQYYKGYKEIPKNTSRSELREIYAYVRSNSQCISQTDVLNGDRILTTIFFEDVKKNFSSVFSSEIKAAEKEFNRWNNYMAKFVPKTTLGKDFKDYFQKNKDKFFVPTLENLKNKSRMDIRKMISFLDGVANHKIVSANADFKKNLTGLRKLKNAMEKYLHQMDPQCMDALEWHEYIPNSKPAAHCKI